MEIIKKRNLEVCISPALLGAYDTNDKIVVLIDILRATSTICTALHYGVKEIIPVSTVEEAKFYKNNGYIVAGERDGKILDFADYGNSPDNFMNYSLKGKSIAYSTTNGTKAVKLTENCKKLVFGGYLNHTLLSNWLIKQNNDVLILCSGWKNRLSLEDTLYAGALSENLLNSNLYISICDSVTASVELWHNAKENLILYIDKCAHRHRLKTMGLDNIIEYCHTFDVTPVIPFYKKNTIIAL